MQVVFREGEVAERAHRLRSEFVLEGDWRGREGPRATRTLTSPTGAIEVDDILFDVLNESAPLPFQYPRGRGGRRGDPGCVASRPGPAPAPAGREPAAAVCRQPRGRGAGASTTSSRSRRQCSPGPPRKARADFLAPARPKPGSRHVLAATPQPSKQLLMVAWMRAVRPVRPLLPGRGLPRRPPAGVHPALHRDELRLRGLRDRPGRAGCLIAFVRELHRRRASTTPVPRITFR